jgi:hypothetical protein
MKRLRKTAAMLAAGGTLGVMGIAAPALAAPPGPAGLGTGLCHAVPPGEVGDDGVPLLTQPPGGPGYGFVAPPPGFFVSPVCGA